MLPDTTPSFGVIDYCVFAAMLIVSVLIGVVMSFRGNKSPEDFLMGNRAFGPIPVAMSLLTSYVSAISLLGFSGEVYANGIQFALLVAGIVLAILFCSVTTLPVFFPLKMTSVNEYITLRFGSTKLRGFVLILICFQGLMYMGVCLYAPTVALTSVTTIDSKTYIYALGVVCTLYSAIGGIKAVVWTDVFQLTVMMIGIVAVVVLGCLEAGGITNVWATAKAGGRFEIFNMNLSIYERHTFPNVLLFGFVFYCTLYGTAQINVQRICCVPTIKEAKLIMYLNVIGMIIIYFFIFTGGLMGYAIYEGCDPFKLGRITKSDQILSFYVVDKLRYIWGLPGLFVATIIGGTLSSLSSVINAHVAMIWRDACLHFKIFANATPKVAAIINKLLSMVIGILLIGMAILASEARSLAQLSYTLSSSTQGAIFGMFLLGLFVPRCNVKGVWCGIVTSAAVMWWMVYGSFMYKSNVEPLPLSIDNCSAAVLETYLNSTAENRLHDHIMINATFPGMESDLQSTGMDHDPYESPLMWLYGISYTYFSFIGATLCVTVGLLVSLLLGFEDIDKVPPELIVTYVRRFYWTKEQLRALSEKNTEKAAQEHQYFNNERHKEKSETNVLLMT